MIALDSTGVIVVEGTASSDPVQPQPTGCQKLLTYVLVAAGETEPTGTDCGTIQNTTIYDETGGTEWTPGTSGLTASFTDTDNPYHLSKDGDLNSFNQSQSFSFTKGSGTIDMNDYYALKFYIRLKSAFHNRLQIGIYFSNTVDGGGSAAIQLQDGLYGFSRTTVGSYQEIVIPMSAFLAFNSGAPSNINVNKLWFLALNQSNVDGFYIDYVQLLGGVCQPPQSDTWVSSVDAGSLSPLFTTTVTNKTTTPYISFAQQSAAANTYYGVGGTAGVPSFLPISNINGQVVTILSDTTISVCSSDAVPVCDTLTVNTVGAIQTVRILSDTTLEVCGPTLCDTLTVTTTSIGQPITANNLLTMSTPSNVQLGGTQVKNTTWTSSTASYRLTYNGVATNLEGAQFDVITTGSNGTALRGEGLQRGVYGVTTTGTGVYGASSGNSGVALLGWSTGTGGVGAYVRSDAGLPLEAITVPSSTNTVLEVFKPSRSSSGAGADGIGLSQGFYLKSSTADRLANTFVSRFQTATDASRTSRFNITGVSNAVEDTLLTLIGNGQALLNKYTGTTFRSVDTTTFKPLGASTVDGSIKTLYWPSGGGSGFTTADNGLTANTATNVQLGGTLTGNTTIDAASYVLSISRASGTPFQALSNTGFASIFQTTPSSTNTTVKVLQINRLTSGTAADGIGNGIQFDTEVDNGSQQTSNNIISKWTTAAAASRTSRMIFTGVNSAVEGDILTLNGNKSIQLNGYGSGTFTGTPTKTLQVDASGNVIEGSSASVLGTQSKGLFVEFPSSSEKVGMWMTPANITITAVKAVLVGSSTPSVTYDLQHGSDITSGTAILSAPVAITSTTTPTSSTSFNDATVPAGNYIWFVTNAQSGSVTSIWITVYYTID